MREVKGENIGFVCGVIWIPILTKFFILSGKSRSGESRLSGESGELGILGGESCESPDGTIKTTKGVSRRYEGQYSSFYHCGNRNKKSLDCYFIPESDGITRQSFICRREETICLISVFIVGGCNLIISFFSGSKWWSGKHGGDLESLHISIQQQQCGEYCATNTACLRGSIYPLYMLIAT